VANALAYYDTATITAVKSFMKLGPGVNLIKLFEHKFTHTFCKLDHFINISSICYIVMKRYSLHSRVCKFMPKKFYEIDSLLKKNLTKANQTFKNILIRCRFE